jgi:Holliday junction resolvase RusA-like endonuclease
MKRCVIINLPGLTRGKGSVRVNTQTHIAYKDAKTASYEGAVRFAGAQAMNGSDPLTGPLSLMAVAVLPIPQGMLKSKSKFEKVLSGKKRPDVKPDWDNIGKALDALKGIAFMDDKQFVDAHIHKHYGMQPSLTIILETIDET